MSAVGLIKKCIFLFKSTKELTLVVRSAKLKIVDIQNGKHYRVKADHLHDFHLSPIT